MVPGQELVFLLSVLYQLLAEQRRGERGLYVLRCLREVARCQACHPERVQEQRMELGKLWVKIWVLAVRGVSSPQTELLSLDLLSSIIQGGLINMDREFWKLFSGSVCKPSKWVLSFLIAMERARGKMFVWFNCLYIYLPCRSAALCLAQALLKCPVPKSLISTSGWDSVGAIEGSTSPNMKETLITWMLMSDQSDEMEDSSRPHPIICRLALCHFSLLFALSKDIHPSLVLIKWYKSLDLSILFIFKCFWIFEYIICLFLYVILR